MSRKDRRFIFRLRRGEDAMPLSMSFRPKGELLPQRFGKISRRAAARNDMRGGISLYPQFGLRRGEDAMPLSMSFRPKGELLPQRFGKISRRAAARNDIRGGISLYPQFRLRRVKNVMARARSARSHPPPVGEEIASAPSGLRNDTINHFV